MADARYDDGEREARAFFHMKTREMELGNGEIRYRVYDRPRISAWSRGVILTIIT